MRNTLVLIALIVGLAIGYIGGASYNSRDSPSSETIIVNDTIYDTITYRKPIEVESVILRYEYTKLPTRDTVFQDSVVVEVPIEQKEYRDSLYHAWVSGYNPSLDSIVIYRPTVKEIIHSDNKNKRWGIGIQIGTGYTHGNIEPYIGIGISYRLWGW